MTVEDISRDLAAAKKFLSIIANDGSDWNSYKRKVCTSKFSNFIFFKTKNLRRAIFKMFRRKII